MSTVDVGDLLDRTFISEPDENGEQMRADLWNRDHRESTSDNMQRLFKFKCEVKTKYLKRS